ncbi:MAG: transcriptional repressor LexA [Acidobacteriota bacterium]|nr:MAG: transcriptional repressor LexA [Acidobacteriota bacterium]
MILTKRQKQILNFIEESIRKNGYAPSLEEISRHFELHSISTIHKHLVNLEDKGFIKRHWNRARAIELLAVQEKPEARDVPLAGLIAAGEPIEAVRGNELVAVPEDMIGRREVYVLKVRGESMVDEQVRDGDYVIVENRTDPKNGEMVVALLNGENATLKKFYREKSQIRLQPAHPTMKPILVQDDEIAIQGVVVGVMRKY